MKLNTDILYDNLSSILPVKHVGPGIQELVLNRPQFYLESTKPEPHGVYIANSSSLPYQYALGNAALLICVGGPPPRIYMLKNRSIFIIDDEMDILLLFNYINQIYDRYDAWEKHLYEILDYNADIVEMIRISAPFFDNRLWVHNNFQITAMADPHADAEADGYGSSDGKFMALELMDHWIDAFLREKGNRDSYYYTSPVGFQYCCNNLFLFGQYAGSVYIEKAFRPFIPSDAACLHFLARYIESAMSKYTRINNSYLISMKSVIANLLNRNPISKEQIVKAFKVTGLADSMNRNNTRYLCLVMHPELSRTVPADYFCSRIEKMFTTCVSLLHENDIVSCIWYNEKELSSTQIKTNIQSFLNESKLKAGISNPFTDIIKIRDSYKQAMCAFDFGNLLDPDKNLFAFSDYMLPYMLLNSTGEFSVEFVCPEGLLSLYQSRDSSGVDYWKTLTTYLENDNNAAKTAKDLFLHRNSLYRRLEHICSVLNTDFHESNQLFLLRFCVKLLELQERIPNFPQGR